MIKYNVLNGMRTREQVSIRCDFVNENENMYVRAAAAGSYLPRRRGQDSGDTKGDGAYHPLRIEHQPSVDAAVHKVRGLDVPVQRRVGLEHEAGTVAERTDGDAARKSFAEMRVDGRFRDVIDPCASPK